MIRIIIVDDHPVVRLGIKGLLESIHDIQVVGEASTGESVVHLVRETHPDVVLMDLSMPGAGGLMATHTLVRTYPQLKIIIVTFQDEDPFPERLLRAGALGYITKKTTEKELVKAIRRVAVGQTYLTPEIAQRIVLRQLSDSEPSPFTQLSAREFQVMCTVILGQKSREIAKKLCLSHKTINTYRYRLFEKLKVKNDVELTHLAIRYGLLEDAKKLLVHLNDTS
jgi:two-component system, NarL family, invasion response regulator UvrY